MKITHLDVVSEDTNIFSLSMQKTPTSDKFLLKASAGLDADQIVRQFYGFGKQTKPPYFLSKMPNRVVTLRIQLNPNFRVRESYSDIRDDLYRAISLNRTGVLELLFRSGGAAMARLTGYITRFEVPLSSEIPEVQITIQCTDSMLRGLNPVILTQADYGGGNPVTLGDNISTSPHGMSMIVTCINDDGFFRVQDKLSFPEWVFQIIPDGGFLTDDIIHLEGEFNNVNVYMERGEEIIPLMDKIESGSLFPVVFPKRNIYYIYDSNNFEVTEISYTPTYWGV